MGLDMYLKSTNQTDLGYWRKHPNLHGYIVQNFAAGVDECQEIPLTVDDILKILKATISDDLPVTRGFFFGDSRPSDKIDTVRIFGDALTNLAITGQTHVIYRASW